VHDPTLIVEQDLHLPLHPNAIGDVLHQHLPIIRTTCREKDATAGK